MVQIPLFWWEGRYAPRLLRSYHRNGGQYQWQVTDKVMAQIPLFWWEGRYAPRLLRSNHRNGGQYQWQVTD